MRVAEIELEVAASDLAAVGADAVVVPTGPDFLMDSEVAARIKARAGAAIEEEAVAKARAGASAPEAVWTTAGGLADRYVIHAVHVAADGATDEHLIRRAGASALRLAAELGARVVALPSLGNGDFPAVGAAKILAQEILRFARGATGAVERLVLCLPTDDEARIFESTVFGYINHVQNVLGRGPYVTVDVIIERPDGVVIIERSNPPYGWALPGGFVDYGEDLETAARREAREETGLDLQDLRQLRTYSDPDRDPRFHTISTVFVAQGQGAALAGDDARDLRVVPYARLLEGRYAFDHHQIIQDYLAQREART